MAFSFLRIFYYNLLHDMRLVESVRLPSFLSKTDPDFVSLRVMPENVTTVG